MSESVQVKSATIGSIMKLFFWAALALACLILGLGVAMVATDARSGPLSTAGTFLLGLFLISYLPLAVATLFWVVLFHGDLRRVFPDYPISPLRAALFMFIPVFNLYGLWRTFASISEYLRASGGRAGLLGDKANLWSTVGYLSIWVLGILTGVVQGLTGGFGASGGVPPWFFVVQSLACTCFVVCYLNSMRLSQAALEERARDGVAIDTREFLTYHR